MFCAPKLPRDFTARFLTPNDIPAWLSLQKAVMDALPSNAKTFFLKKTEKQILERMTTLGKAIGIYALSPQGERLVASSCVAFPTKDWPVADMALEPEIFPYPWDSVGVFQSNAVHPFYRGCHFHRFMLFAQESICKNNGRKHAMAEVAIHNPASLKGFTSCGFHATKAHVAAADGRKLLILHKDLSAIPPLKLEPALTLHAPIRMFEQLHNLFANGYHGAGIERTEGPDGYALRLDLSLAL